MFNLPGPTAFNAMFVLIFVVVIGGFVFVIGKALFTTVNNLGQPLLEREARVIGKRQETSVSGGQNNMPASSSTSHYVAFEFVDGSRAELSVPGSQYGLLAEGDHGTLRSQGTWFKGFSRRRIQ